MLDSLLAGVVLFTSFAMRTSNVQPNPDDYEFSLGIKKGHWFLNTQWERELGSYFTDTHFWYQYEGHRFYFKPEYLDKESNSVSYAKLDSRLTRAGFSLGITTRSLEDNLYKYENFISGGYVIEKTYEKLKLDFSMDGYYTEVFDYETKFNIGYKLIEKVWLYQLGEFYFVQGEHFYKAKVGIEIKL